MEAIVIYMYVDGGSYRLMAHSLLASCMAIAYRNSNNKQVFSKQVEQLWMQTANLLAKLQCEHSQAQSDVSIQTLQRISLFRSKGPLQPGNYKAAPCN